MKQFGHFGSDAHGLKSIELRGLNHDPPQPEPVAHTKHPACMQDFPEAVTMTGGHPQPVSSRLQLKVAI